MPLGSREHADPRRALEPVGVHVPARAREHVVPSGEQRGHVRHLAAGDEGGRDAVRQAEQLREPGARDLLDHRCARAADVEAGVLVPRRGQPVRGDRGRQRAADDEAEVAAARNPDRRPARLRPRARRSPRAGPHGPSGSGPPSASRSSSTDRRLADRAFPERLEEVGRRGRPSSGAARARGGLRRPQRRQDTQPGRRAASGAGSAGSADGARSRRGRARRRAGGRGRRRRARCTASSDFPVRSPEKMMWTTCFGGFAGRRDRVDDRHRPLDRELVLDAEDPELLRELALERVDEALAPA